MRKKEGSLLLVDCGRLLGHGRYLNLKADISLESLNLMGYDALNLGSHEFLLGADYLRDKSSDLDLSFVSSNLVYDKSRFPWIHSYVIKTVNNIRVAILGVMPADDFEHIQGVEGLKVVPLETALNDIMPEIRKKADFTVLLSQAGFKATALLIQKNGIDMAVSCGNTRERVTVSNTRVVQARGPEIGLVRATKDDTGKFLISKSKHIKLNDSVPNDERTEKLITGVRREIERLKAEKQRKIHEESLKGLELSPEEFVKKYQERLEEEKN